MATNALISVNELVDRFCFKYKILSEDASLFVEHACNAIRDFHLYDSPNVVTEKIAVSALGIVDMPTDMVGFNGLFMPSNGEYWEFTRKDTLVNTTTFTGLVEGQDDHFGEGEAVNDPETDTYGGVGGVNDYYYTIDWKARRIFCEGIVGDIVILKYTTSGIELTGTTNVPEFITPMIDSYLLWKSSYWLPALVRERDMLEKDFNKAELKIRNLINSMTYSEWHDLLLSTTTQVPIR